MLKTGSITFCLLSPEEIDYAIKLDKYKLELQALGLSEQQVTGLITICRYAAEETLSINSSFILFCARRLVEQIRYGAAWDDVKAWCLRLPTSVQAEWLVELIRRYVE